MNKYFAAIDAGSKEISAVAARWNKSGDYVIEGYCRAPSKGFRKGLVTDTALAADTISRVMKKLREKTGKNIHDVYAGVSSTSLRIVPSSSVHLLSKFGRLLEPLIHTSNPLQFLWQRLALPQLHLFW